MTAEPTQERPPGTGQDPLRDGDMPQPYPDDTPGGVQDGADPDSDGTANLQEAAEEMGSADDNLG